MSESNLVTYRNLTRNYGRRTGTIGKITFHHAAGVGSAKGITDSFVPARRKASAQYIIGNVGDIGQSVSESNRAWTSSCAWNDNLAVTIEVSNSKAASPWPISDAAYKSMINLAVDICQRNNIASVYYDGTPNGVLTEHRMYAKTVCPGDTIHELLASGKIEQDVNKRLQAQESVSGYIYKGIDMGAVFDPAFYGSRHKDLAKAGITTPAQLWIHFCTFGMMEGRMASAGFDPLRYRKIQTDLNAAFGDDWEAYYKHYCMCGREEIESGQRKVFM